MNEFEVEYEFKRKNMRQLTVIELPEGQSQI